MQQVFSGMRVEMKAQELVAKIEDLIPKCVRPGKEAQEVLNWIFAYVGVPVALRMARENRDPAPDVRPVVLPAGAVTRDGSRQTVGNAVQRLYHYNYAVTVEGTTWLLWCFTATRRAYQGMRMEVMGREQPLGHQILSDGNSVVIKVMSRKAPHELTATDITAMKRERDRQWADLEAQVAANTAHINRVITDNTRRWLTDIQTLIDRERLRAANLERLK